MICGELKNDTSVQTVWKKTSRRLVDSAVEARNHHAYMSCRVSSCRKGHEHVSAHADPKLSWMAVEYLPDDLLTVVRGVVMLPLWHFTCGIDRL